MSSESSLAVRPFDELVSDLTMNDASRYHVDGLSPSHAVQPGSVEELSEIMRSIRAGGLRAIPWGGGSQMGVGNAPSGYDVAIDLTGINEVLRYDPEDMTMSVQAGCRLQDLNRMLGEHRQALPVDTAFPDRATIGGVTAVGASGPRRLGYGPLRDLIIGMSVVSVDGVVSKAGGQVVKNVTGFDMMRMHHGALGSLGIIVSINLKVIPKPQSERTVIATFRSLEHADNAAKAVVQSQLGVTALVATNPEATSEIVETSDRLWAVSVRCEAPPSAVVRQAERVSDFVGADAESIVVVDSSEDSAGRWAAICRALDQRQESPDIAIRIGRAASRLGAAGAGLTEDLQQFGACRVTLDYGSGLAYIRAGREAIEPGQHGAFFRSVSQHGDHATLMTGTPEMKQDNDVFGGPRAGFNVFESLKSTFDPARTLNPGRSVGRL